MKQLSTLPLGEFIPAKPDVPVNVTQCYIKAITGLDVLASWLPHGFDWASLMMTWGHLGHYLGTTWG